LSSIDINSPLKIRGVELRNRLMLAPVNGVFDTPFRTICLEMNPGLTYSEMMNARSISGKHVIKNKMLMRGEGERPFAIQISEHVPELLASAARVIEEHKLAEWIDFNCGCPSRTVTNSGNGSALMRSPELLGSLVKAIRENTSLPFSVKIRAGWDDLSRNAIEIAAIAEDNGADLVTVHGRTRTQMYGGKADWDMIAQVKDKLSIPVIGNGDIFTYEDARKMLEQTSCDGVMIARGAFGNPWLIRRILGKNDILVPTLDEIESVILKHIDLQDKLGIGTHRLRRMRKHIPWYIKGLANATKLRVRMNAIGNRAEMEATVREYFEYIT